MQDFIQTGEEYRFDCKCGNSWTGYDAGDAFCEKCGKYAIDSRLSNEYWDKEYEELQKNS